MPLRRAGGVASGGPEVRLPAQQRTEAADDADSTHNGAEPVRVLIVDDHDLLRRGIETILSAEPDIEVVGEAVNGAQAVDLVAELLPDIVLMDVRMPRLNGIEACLAMK